MAPFVVREHGGGGALHLHGVKVLSEAAIRIEGELSHGRFKQVRKGTLKIEHGSSREIVVLRFAREDTEVRELEVLVRLANHPCSKAFVPDTFGVCSDRRTTSVVQERARWGTLLAVISNDSRPHWFATDHRFQIAAKSVHAMDFLQSLRIVHADLACRNILVFDLHEDPLRVVVKVTDFGLAVMLKENGPSSERRKQPQATRWCAPETVAYNKFSLAADVWSFGVTLWELFADGMPPWTKREKRTCVAAMLRDLAEKHGVDEGGADMSYDFPIPDGCPAIMHEAILSCLRADESSRPSFKQIADAIYPDPGCEDAFDEDTRDGELSGISEHLAPFTDCSTASSAASEDCRSPKSSKGGSLVSPQRRVMENKMSLHDLLWSPDAVAVYGEEAVALMRMEFENTKAREAYLADLAARQRQPPSPDVSSRRALTQLPDDACVLPRSPYNAALPLQSRLRPGEGRTWTIWSLASAAVLQRQDFPTEAHAREAFRTVPCGIPCVLRNTEGQDVEARSWVQLRPRLCN